MNIKEKLIVLNEGVYFLYTIIIKMKMNKELPSLTTLLQAEYIEIRKKIEELEAKEHGDTCIDNR